MKKGKKHQQTNYHHIYSLCNQHMNQYVLAQTVDGQNIDGIITGVDGDYVYLAVPLTDEERKQLEQEKQHNQIDERQYGYGYAPGGYAGYGGYGAYGGYGYGAPYGYGYAPPNRFRRLILPLAALVAISALPWY